jgi:hypothetical protein
MQIFITALVTVTQAATAAGGFLGLGDRKAKQNPPRATICAPRRPENLQNLF